MITNFFIPELNNHDVQELWFQQDGVTCHTARATIDLLKDTFGDRLISRFGPVNWPPRSCDLTPLDYFLWGYVKSLVYADKPQTLDHLEDNIRRVIADIRPQMLEKVIENWTSRLDYIRASRGSHMPEIILKISKTACYVRNCNCFTLYLCNQSESVNEKPHRLLPTNLYVVLYNFRSRHPDEIDLKAGCIITVTDTSDADWWQGKCMGKIGYFPSKYVTKLHPGEQPLQVMHSVHVNDGESGLKLLSEQVR
ncbi:uncharacterized protein TNCV_700331 [Trichonephila clavipes]|nr:uncharacterized protein TNCV_700331 [Trichonephila clavipes]